MKRAIIFFLLGLRVALAIGQAKPDTALQHKLRIMFKEDQRWRIEYMRLQRKEKSDYDEKTIQANWTRADSLNALLARAIFAKYGFPGFDTAGESGSNAFWAVVQHCDDDPEFQQQVLKAMLLQVKRHNASAENYAYLEDRILVNKGEKQLYGTQLRYDPKKHKNKALPIQDSINVDKRRKAVGLAPLKIYIEQVDKLSQ